MLPVFKLSLVLQESVWVGLAKHCLVSIYVLVYFIYIFKIISLLFFQAPLCLFAKLT